MKNPRTISIAPMIDCTDRHFRYFMRLINFSVFLYTEMIPVQRIVHSKNLKFLDYHSSEKPLALQLGGSDPAVLAQCAKLGENLGYDEINLNVGCPSEQVQSGNFGACLMKSPKLVANCVAAMHSAIKKIPITVKTRIGVDHQDSYDELCVFINEVAKAGCHIFIIHARKAWLQGLSPRQNRQIPPLNYPYVYQLKRDFPQLTFLINGGIKNVEEINQHLNFVDGVMIGRQAYDNPYFLVNTGLSRKEILLQFIPYVEKQLSEGVLLWHIIRHILGLFHGQEGARNWRRFICEKARTPGVGSEIILQSMEIVTEEAAPFELAIT